MTRYAFEKFNDARTSAVSSWSLPSLPLRYPKLALEAPPAIADRDPELSGRPSGHEPDYRGKGRVGEFNVRDLLYRHPAAHRGRQELDHLYRLFAENDRRAIVKINGAEYAVRERKFCFAPCLSCKTAIFL
jgi:hypothetical protein